jgi:hypothetical protein
MGETHNDSSRLSSHRSSKTVCLERCQDYDDNVEYQRYGKRGIGFNVIIDGQTQSGQRVVCKFL